MKIEIYTKDGCPLCDEAKQVLRAVQSSVPFELVETDIQSDPALFERYRYDIPVVFIDGRKAFKHRLRPDQLLERLHRGTSVAHSPDREP